MTFKSIALSTLCLALLAACEPATQGDRSPGPVEDDCGAAGYQGLLGQSRSALAVISFPDGTRQIGPNDAVTADYRPDRLNIEYDRNGVVDKISCY